MSRIGNAVFRLKAPLVVPGSYREWRRLQSVAEWDSAKLAEYSRERARAIAFFAFRQSPFYRDYYSAHGLRERDFCSADVVAALPLMTKQLLREHASSIPTPESSPRTASRSVSSGSTGEPLALLRDTRVPARAYEWRLWDWWGVSPGDNVAIIDRHYRTPREVLKQRALWWPARRIQMDTFDMSESAVERFISQWKETRPDYLTGYTGGVVSLVRLAAAKGLSLRAPKAIGVTAGPLLPAQRVEIESYFGAPVYDHYRTSEANWLAGECAAQDGLHLFQDIKHIEVLTDGRPAAADEVGEVVITDTTNRVFPIIRYAIGDLTAPMGGDCSCGRPHPRVQPIQGRTIDALAFPSGKVIVGGLTGTFAGMDEYVRQFQIYQGEDYAVEVRVILTHSPAALAQAEARVQRLRENVGGEAVVSMKVVEHIAPIKGKLRYIISDAPRVPATTTPQDLRDT